MGTHCLAPCVGTYGKNGSLDGLHVLGNPDIDFVSVYSPDVHVGLMASISQGAVGERRSLTNQRRPVNESLVSCLDTCGTGFGVRVILWEASWRRIPGSVDNCNTRLRDRMGSHSQGAERRVRYCCPHLETNDRETGTGAQKPADGVVQGMTKIEGNVYLFNIMKLRAHYKQQGTLTGFKAVT